MTIITHEGIQPPLLRRDEKLWTAYMEGRPELLAVGGSEAEAVGRLIIRESHRFLIAIRSGNMLTPPK
ncbi:MAG TPA: hypothetical protein VJJ22_02860 [Candidatus Paceibacterota bacterium]